MMEEDGWPLGLQLMNARARSLEIDFTRSSSLFSLTTLFTSTDLASSSSFSSESTKTPYLESLLDEPNTLRLSITSTTLLPSQQPQSKEKKKKNQSTQKPKSWLLSLCSNPASHDTDSDHNDTTQEARLSLGHLLEQERVMSIRRGLEG